MAAVAATSRGSEKGSPWLATATTLLSAYLVFQVQPLLARSLLSRFGGSSAVWTTAMLFFQAGLLLGYAYAAFVATRLAPRTQLFVHVALLLSSLLVLPIGPRPEWRPALGANPQAELLWVLIATIGAPFVLLSTTSPLVQAWVARGSPDRSPYRLYAASNAGSLLGLLAYPFLIEPAISVRAQAQLWSAGYLAFAVLCAVTATRELWSLRSEPTRQSGTETARSSSPRWLWLGLSAAGSTLLFAVTNELTLDVASVPFLWVLPLSLYLVSFILCFESDRWYVRRFWALAMVAGIAGIGWIGARATDVGLGAHVAILGAALLACCMVCHGELARLRPAASELTTFYLVLALGGALGGLFVSLLAPLLFDDLFELPLGLGAAVLLALTAARGDSSSPLAAVPTKRFALLLASAALVLVALPALGAWRKRELGVVSARNFYGTLEVRVERPPGLTPRRVMAHGATRHGIQLLDPAHELDGTGYYAPEAGGGLAIASAPSDGLRRVGLIGLGVGTLARYGRPGDTFRFYEINPAVVALAKAHFSYLSRSAASIEVVVDDARLALEHEPDNHFDVLVLDAFSGDSVPAHLLTIEAFRLYFRHLRPDGALAVHASNHYLDLVSLVRATARALGKSSRVVRTQGDDGRGVLPAEWVLVASSETRLNMSQYPTAGPAAAGERAVTPWTDDYGSLFSLVR